MKDYYEDDFETDIEWFKELGVSRKDAEDYIIYMLNEEPSKEMKKKMKKILILRNLENEKEI